LERDERISLVEGGSEKEKMEVKVVDKPSFGGK
jgi:hypothetical protein